MEKFEKIKSKDFLRTVFRTLGFVRKNYPKSFWFVVVCSIVTGIASYLQTVSFSKIVDIIISVAKTGGGIPSSLWKPLISMAIFMFVPSILGTLQGIFKTFIQQRSDVDLQVLRSKSFAKLDIATVEDADFQKKLQQAQEWGMGSITNLFLFSMSIVTNIASTIMALVLLSFVAPSLIPIAMVSALPLYFIEKKYGVKLFQARSFGGDDRRIAGNRTGHFLNASKLIDLILNRVDKKFIGEIQEKLKGTADFTIAIKRKKDLWGILTGTLSMICLILSVIIITKSAIARAISIGLLVVAYNSYRGFEGTIKNFLSDFAFMQESARYAKQWFDLIDTKPVIADVKNAISLTPETPPLIEFKNVSFRYPEKDKDTLKNLNFTLVPGEKIALVGHNGAGKTTLIRLLTRVYDPTEGVILVNGIDLKQIKMNDWRKLLAVMQQDYANYNLTLKESIAISQPEKDIDMDMVERAAKLSGVDDFLDELPKGYDQLIWKGFQDGVELSKGQHQRIAVARTFYRDALVTIVDEPTAAIDAIAEEKIFNSIEEEMVGKTIVLISHRFSTVKNADKIIFFEHGEIQEQGSHGELMAIGGKYAELYTMQADRYKDQEVIA
jgi:ABC-type multidrug transport system fused ATPase/permease subunit